MILSTYATKFAALVLAIGASAAPGSMSTSAVAGTPYLVGSGLTAQTLMTRECGGQMWSVGTFTSIGSPGRQQVTRNNVVAFDPSTGVIAAVNPDVNGTVSSITFSPDCSSAYIGGAFTAVGGTPVQNIAKFDTTTGLVDRAFAHSASGRVSAVQYTAGHLLVGGYFSTINGSTGSSGAYLTGLNATTGNLDGYASNLGVRGGLPSDPTHIYKMWLSPAGDRIAVDGAFVAMFGQARRQVAILDLTPGGVSLDPWYASALAETCVDSGEAFYAKALAWSPDGAFVYVASTGFSGATLCDSIAKFSSAPSSTQAPVWINKTGGDSVFSVVATATDVYVGGHQRWLDNPYGRNSCGPGCVARPGIGAVDASTGVATPWNPTRSRGHGASDLFIDSAGDLWVSSDAPGFDYCAGAYHPGICEFAAPAPPTH